MDPAGALVPGATVQLTHDLSQQVRKFVTESNGSFIFTGLVPGTYSLHVAQAGFKSYDQKGITVSAQERVDLHEIHLPVGDVTSTVEVQANAVHVATDSSDRSVDINLNQIEDTPTRGRNPISLIMTLPGTQSLAQSYDYRGWNGGGIPGVNGGQQGQIILNMDGAASQDSGNLNTGYISPSVDAIGEVKLLVSNYTAEYGGRTAGQLTVTTKNGTPQFHGSAYDYYRHESLNANEFFNNKTNVVRPRYRYQNFGGTVGGPLIIPGTRVQQGTAEAVLLLLVRQAVQQHHEFCHVHDADGTGEDGRFLEDRDHDGRADSDLRSDHANAVSAGNVIPANRISPQGQAMLNLFPNPDPAGPGARPDRATADITSATRSSSCGRWTTRSCAWTTTSRRRCRSTSACLQDYQAQNGYNVTVGPPGGAWGQFPASYHVQAAGALGTLIYTISPTLINEVSWGINRGKQGVDPLDRCQQQPEHRRREELCAEPAAAEGRQRQRADAAAHQLSRQQLLEPAAGGQLRPASRITAPSPRARA